MIGPVQPCCAQGGTQLLDGTHAADREALWRETKSPAITNMQEM